MNKFEETLKEVFTWCPNEPTKIHIENILVALTQAAEIERGDKVVVPREPTQDMIDAACQLGWIRQLYDGKPQWLSPGIGVRMNKAYKSMLAASGVRDE